MRAGQGPVAQTACLGVGGAQAALQQQHVGLQSLQALPVHHVCARQPPILHTGHRRFRTGLQAAAPACMLWPASLLIC